MSQAFSLEVRSRLDVDSLQRELRRIWSGGGVDGAITESGSKVFCFSYFYGRFTPRFEIASLVNYLRAVADEPGAVWYWSSCGFEQPCSEQERDADLERMYAPGAPECPGFPEDEPRRFHVPLGRITIVDGQLVAES